jgi:hypothetical protein
MLSSSAETLSIGDDGDTMNLIVSILSSSFDKSFFLNSIFGLVAVGGSENRSAILLQC